MAEKSACLLECPQDQESSVVYILQTTQAYRCRWETIFNRLSHAEGRRQRVAHPAW